MAFAAFLRWLWPESPVSELSLQISRSSTTKAEVTWSAEPRVDRYNVQLTESSSQDGVERSVYNDDVTDTAIERHLNAGNFYKVTVKGMRQTYTGESICVAKGSASFRAERTIKQRLQQLHRIAVERHVDSTHDTLEVFFRTKTEEYFQDIEENCGNIMEVNMKDANGDQDSPINGVLKGLFFNANVNIAHRRSPFGKKRLSIPADVMFQKMPNLYFTDFYCNKTQHYVTLVMTKEGSEADNFCRDKLIRLDVATNPFVRYRQYGRRMSVANHDDIIEILYAENIDISDMIERHEARFSSVSWTGRQMHGGMPKNRWCTVCNI